MPKQGFIARAYDFKSHLMKTCDLCETEYWLENNKIGNDDTESQKNQACFETYGTDV